MTLALRVPPPLEAGAALPLRAWGYCGNAGRTEATFPATLAFPRAARSLTAIRCAAPPIAGVTLRCRVEVLEIGVSPALSWGEVWGVRLRKPITGLSFWLDGPDAGAWHLSWACCFRLLGFSDPAGTGDWRTGLHGKDPLVGLRVALVPPGAAAEGAPT